MTNTYDYGETVPIHADYFSTISGAPADQTGATVAVYDSAGTVLLAATAMIQDATGVYSYNYVVPAAGPAGMWYYVTTGTDASGYKTINTVHFEVKAKVAPHTIPDNVREILPDLLVAEDDVGTIASGTTMTLKKDAVGVPSILKNATVLYESTNYTFKQPRAITLLSAASSENYIAHVHREFTDEQLIKFIAKSDRKIDNYFYGLTTPSAAYLDDWSAHLTAGYVLRIKAKGSTDMLDWAKSLEDMALNEMEAYKKGTGGTVYDDSKVTRSDATSVPDFLLDQRVITNYGSED